MFAETREERERERGGKHYNGLTKSLLHVDGNTQYGFLYGEPSW